MNNMGSYVGYALPFDGLHKVGLGDAREFNNCSSSQPFLPSNLLSAALLPPPRIFITPSPTLSNPCRNNVISNSPLLS